MARSLLPHGLYSLCVVFLATSGWMASLWEGDGCNYATVTGPIVNQLDPSYTKNNPITTLQLGFDSYREIPIPMEKEYDSSSSSSSSSQSSSSQFKQQQQQQETPSSSSSSLTAAITTAANNVTDILLPHRTTTASCIEYPDEVTLGIMDSSWNTSRVFCFLGLVLGGAGTTFLFCSVCFVFSKVTWRWTGYELLLASLCQTISLATWFRTQLCSWNTCGLSRGSMSDIVAVGLWTLSGLLIVCHYPHSSNISSSGGNNNNNNNNNNSSHDDDDDDDDDEDDDGSDGGSNNKNKKSKSNAKFDLVVATIGTEEDDIEIGQKQQQKQQQQQQQRHDDDDDNRRFPQAEIA